MSRNQPTTPGYPSRVSHMVSSHSNHPTVMTKIEQRDVVLLQPPFFRFCGSHNDRMPLSLCYFSRFLKQAGVSNVVFNADHTGATDYWKWGWLFDHFDSFKDGVDGKGSLYGEVIEQIMSFSPKAVVIMAGDPLFSHKDLGNAFIGTNFAKMLKERGVFTVGFGTFYTAEPEKFKGDFDCLFVGEPSSEIIRVVQERIKGRTPSQLIPTNILPNLQNLFPAGQKTDALMTSFGCAYNCTFCMNKKVRPGVASFIEMSTVLRDLLQRPEQKICLCDMNFPVSLEHLKNLAELIENNNIHKEFTIDSRVDCLDQERLDLLKRIGVKTVKIGIEGATAEQLKVFNKKTTPEMNLKAVEVLRKNGFKVIGYFILGGPGVGPNDYEVNLQWLKKLDLDHVVVNVWSYDLTTDYRYDTHFSPVSLERWGIPKEVFHKYLDFQQGENPTVGNLIG